MDRLAPRAGRLLAAPFRCSSTPLAWSRLMNSSLLSPRTLPRLTDESDFDSFGQTCDSVRGTSRVFLPPAAQTSPPNRARLAADRTGSAWNIGRNIQALRPAELPLRRRTWTRAQTISVH